MKLIYTGDFERLKDFGFKGINYVNGNVYKYSEVTGKIELYNIIIGQDKVIHYNQTSVYNCLPSIIYDLIQAGFVKRWKNERNKI